MVIALMSVASVMGEDKAQVAEVSTEYGKPCIKKFVLNQHGPADDAIRFTTPPGKPRHAIMFLARDEGKQGVRSVKSYSAGHPGDIETFDLYCRPSDSYVENPKCENASWPTNMYSLAVIEPPGHFRPGVEYRYTFGFTHSNTTDFYFGICMPEDWEKVRPKEMPFGAEGKHASEPWEQLVGAFGLKPRWLPGDILATVIEHGDSQRVTALVKKGYDVKSIASVAYAVRSRDLETLKLVLGLGADPNRLRPGAQLYPLQYVATWTRDANAYAMAELLVRGGARLDVSAPPNPNYYPKGRAAVKAMFERTPKPANMTVEEYALYIEREVDDYNHAGIHEPANGSCTRGGETPLTIAVYYKNPKMVRKLLELGADPLLPDKDTYVTALEIAGRMKACSIQSKKMHLDDKEYLDERDADIKVFEEIIRILESSVQNAVKAKLKGGTATGAK